MPALLIIAVTNNPTMALVLSQVVLSMGIPFALIPLINLTSSQKMMGPLVNKFNTKVIGYFVVGLLTLLNLSMIALLAL